MEEVRVDIDQLRDLGLWYGKAFKEVKAFCEELDRIKKALHGEVMRKDAVENKKTVFHPSPDAQHAYDSLEKLKLHIFVYSVNPVGHELLELYRASNKQIIQIEESEDPGPRGLRSWPTDWTGLITSPGAILLRSMLDWSMGKVGGTRPAYASPAKHRGEGDGWDALTSYPDFPELFGRVKDLDSDQIEIVKVNGSEAPPRYIVFIRGITTTVEDNVNSGIDAGKASLLSVSQHSKAVLNAMRKAGIKKGSNVMFVGHSQGGITSLNLACDPKVNSAQGKNGYVNITHVAVAGSPIGDKNPPKGTRVLAIENNADVVPDLDTEDEKSRTGKSVIRVARRGELSAGEAHGLKSGYIPEMEREEFRTEPRVEKYLESAQPYLGRDFSPPQRFNLHSGTDPALPQPPEVVPPLRKKVPSQAGGLTLEDLQSLPR